MHRVLGVHVCAANLHRKPACYIAPDDEPVLPGRTGRTATKDASGALKILVFVFPGFTARQRNAAGRFQW